MFKGASANWRDLLRLKDEKIQELKAELENTQKNLRMLNFGTQNLDQILIMGQSVHNRNCLGYTGVISDVTMTSKTMLVKAAATTSKHLIFGKIFKPASPKVKRFFPTCYFYNMHGHIRPRCYKYIKFLKMKKNENFFYASRTTPKIKVELDKSLNKLWIRRSDLFCNVAYTSLKAIITDSWYFDSGCSRNMTDNKKYLIDYHFVAESHVSFSDGEK